MANRHTQRVTLTGWRGQTFGLRVSAESMRLVFEPLRRNLHHVTLRLPNHPVQPRCTVTPTFWTKCPELRSAEVGIWMQARGDWPWPYRHPPHYQAELVGNILTILD